MPAGQPAGRRRYMPLSFNKKPALVAYVTCGDPNLATTREIVLAAIGAGADVIELGVPFSDPVADGPVIQRASQRAIQQGTTLRQVLQLAADVRERSQAGRSEERRCRERVERWGVAGSLKKKREVAQGCRQSE